MLKKLIGSQIVSVNESTIKIRTPQGEIRHLDIVEDKGDCCGFNDWTIKIFEDEIQRNPVITNVVLQSDGSCGEEDTATLTFFGEYAPMVEVDSLSSSGSGWCYGACVEIVCRETTERNTITVW